MKFEQIQPPPYLREYVRYIWTLENTASDATPKTFAPVADGCPGLIFQQSDLVRFYDQDEKKLPDLFLYGQSTKHTTLHAPGKFNTIGIYFYPNALKSVFGINAEELTNTCIDVNLISQKDGFSITEQLLNTPDLNQQIDILNAYLFSMVQKNKVRLDGGTQFAISKIITSKGSVPLKELLENLKVSERSFERKFKEEVGISPKMFSRICRFQASLNQLRNNDFSKLSDIAFENDYSDQSHFIRTFKEFTGISPYQFTKQSKEVIENFPEWKI